MLEKIFAPVLRFFGIVATSLTGISAVFTAVGFLAERSHLYMLRFTAIPVDLNQYLYTGARFFAYLPISLVSAMGASTARVRRMWKPPGIWEVRLGAIPVESRFRFSSRRKWSRTRRTSKFGVIDFPIINSGGNQ